MWQALECRWKGSRARLVAAELLDVLRTLSGRLLVEGPSLNRRQPAPLHV